MAPTELIIVSSTPELALALGAFDGVRVATAPSIAFAQRLTTLTPPPGGMYVDDTLGTPDELWGCIRACQAAAIAVCVGVWSNGRGLATDVHDAAIPVAPDTARSAEPLAAWLAAQFGLNRRASARGQALLVVAGAKGGVGKTLVTSLWAEALHRRGLRVLVVDCDLSNSGLLPTFRIPGVFPSYLQARADHPADWSTPERLRDYVYHHDRSGLDFLLGSDEASATAADLHLKDWDALLRGVRALDEYDVVLLDTGPEIKRRPYALVAARNGGTIICPVPPGRKERVGAANLLHWLQDDGGLDLTPHCGLLLMEPEHGSAVTVAQVLPKLVQLFPNAAILGTLPRAPRQVSHADEYPDTYVSPLDLAPQSRFTRSVYALVAETCALAELTPPLPAPRFRWWQRLRSNQWRDPAAIVRQPTVIQMDDRRRQVSPASSAEDQRRALG